MLQARPCRLGQGSSPANTNAVACVLTDQAILLFWMPFQACAPHQVIRFRRPGPPPFHNLYPRGDLTMLEFLQTLSWAAVFQIILIDILLGGDNAVVIALACRNLDAKRRMQGIMWGTAGAI